jgi:hypothetical protein
MWNTVAMAECIKGNCVNGVGTFEMKGVYTYTGQFKNGKPDGRGEVVHSNGNRYVGEVKEDKYNGQGIFYYADGGKLEGQFRTIDQMDKGLDITLTEINLLVNIKTV